MDGPCPGQACEAEGKLGEVKKSYAKTEQRLKDTLFHLAEVEKSRKKVESALTRFEKQAEEAKAS